MDLSLGHTRLLIGECERQGLLRNQRIAAFALALLVAACTAAGGTFCDVARPIRLSEQAIAAMSDQEVGEALAHDRKGANLCGWKP